MRRGWGWIGALETIRRQGSKRNETGGQTDTASAVGDDCVMAVLDVMVIDVGDGMGMGKGAI